MRHLDEGQLRAALDDQLDGEAALHLSGCPECQARLETLRADLQPVQQRLAWLSSRATGRGPDPRASLARFHRQEAAHLAEMTVTKKEKSMFQKLFGSRAFQVGLAAALVLALIAAIPTTRAWAGEFLGLFRIQKVAVLPIDTSGIEQLSGNEALGQQINQMMAGSVHVTEEPGDPVQAADAAEASQLAGFRVRLPAEAAGTPALMVTSGSAYEMKIDRAKVQAVLDEAGRSDLVLPRSLDGANIQVRIPAGVQAAYGACPSSAEQGQEGDPDTPGQRYADCVLLVEMPSPTVNTPPDVDFQQLAVLGLQFTGMSRQQAEEFSQTVDWTTSLVIPIPRNAASYETVTVDGVEGKLIEHRAGDASQYVLVWVKDGVIHAISGWGDGADTAVKMADSLK